MVVLEPHLLQLVVIVVVLVMMMRVIRWGAATRLVMTKTWGPTTLMEPFPSL
jgi:hypothetical protein